MNLAVIPARGGSVRIPRKNIKFFCGKPMLAWSIEAAKASSCFDRIIVSTDDAEIAEIAQDFGAEVPFIRPSELSGNFVGTIPVIAHAIAWQRNQGIVPSAVCCIYATAPFISSHDLQKGKELLEKLACDYVFPVTSFASRIQRAIRITEKKRAEMFYPELFNARSQDLEDAFHDAGQFYWGQTDAWLSGKPIFARGSVPIILPRWRVHDIDTQEDWILAEWMFKAMKLQKDEL